MLTGKDYLKERESIQRRLAVIEEEKKSLKLRLAPLNALIAAAGAETNGNGNGAKLKDDSDSEWEFDCRSEGCDRVGENGFASAQARGVHESKAHGIKGASKK